MNGFEKRTAQKKEQILTAAFNLMDSDAGVNHLTMDQLALDAHVGKSTIFKYFGSKEQVIAQVFDHFLMQLSKGADDILAQSLSFEETFKRLSQQKLDLLTQVNQQFYLDLMAFLTTQPTDNQPTKMATYSQISLNMMLNLFHRGRLEGKVDLKYSDEFLMMYFNALITGISNPDIYATAIPYTEQWTAVFLNGIAPH